MPVYNLKAEARVKVKSKPLDNFLFFFPEQYLLSVIK